MVTAQQWVVIAPIAFLLILVVSSVWAYQTYRHAQKERGRIIRESNAARREAEAFTRRVRQAGEEQPQAVEKLEREIEQPD